MLLQVEKLAGTGLPRTRPFGSIYSRNAVQAPNRSKNSQLAATLSNLTISTVKGTIISVAKLGYAFFDSPTSTPRNEPEN